MTALLSLLLFLLTILLALPVAYLALLTLCSARLRIPQPTHRNLRFDVFVPAHNEAQVIARTIASLRQLDWPSYRLIVIADNCSDDTAAVARRAGSEVIERQDTTRRGKGYALAFGFAQMPLSGADAAVVVDADTVVSPNLLAAFAARIETGAQALQANYGVLNPDDSWRTRIVTIAYGAFHAVRSRSRERLGLSCGLRGNGICLTRALLDDHPFNVYSMAEDLEYGVRLGLAGIRVHYVDEASADAELVSAERSARSQRQRWESGRFAVAKRYAGPLLKRAIDRRDPGALELALDLLTPPIGYLGAGTVILAILGCAGFALGLSPNWLLVAALFAAVLAAHVLRGWQLCPLGWRALLALAYAPLFIIWKIVTLIRQRGNRDWIRTDRDQQ